MSNIKSGNYLVTEKTLSQIALLTSIKNHGEAYRVGSEMLGKSELSVRFNDIEFQRKRLGHLSLNLQYERRNAYDEMMNFARAHMSAADFQLFYSVF